MQHSVRTYSMPRLRVTRWLADAGPDVPDDIRRALIAGLFGTLPIFAGGVINTVLISTFVALRSPTAPFIAWAVLEAVLAVVRTVVLLTAFRRADAGKDTPTDLYLMLAVLWAASVGYGAFISMFSGDWAIATVACMSAAAMVGGICFRNFAAPRLAAVMVFLSLGPTVAAAPFSGEALMLVTFVQVPFYLLAMRSAADKLNALLVSTMRAEREHEHQAQHDHLTGLSNRIGLLRAMNERDDRRIALLYLDLDGFKAVNDSFGHAVGDRLLQLAAHRLRGALRSDDVAARIGGDEFVAIAKGVDRTQAQAFGERLIRAFEEPFAVGPTVEVRIGASVGIALAPDHGEHVSELLNVADSALYQAKTSGKSLCVVASLSSRPQSRVA